MAIYSYFTVRNQTVDLELSSSLYERVRKLATYLCMRVCDILELACVQYGVSVEAVERYLDNDRKEEMRIAENFEL